MTGAVEQHNYTVGIFRIKDHESEILVVVTPLMVDSVNSKKFLSASTREFLGERDHYSQILRSI